MVINNLFPTPVVFFKFGRNLTEAELDFIKGQERHANEGNTTSNDRKILKSKELTELRDFIEDSMLEYFKAIHAPKFDVSLYLTQSWANYTEKNAVKEKTNCPYCASEFWPLGHKQIYCTRKCANEARVDNGYFGGKRRETIGLAERTCQLCGRKDVKGLSSHHMLGKENDPENQYLVALCPGCHHLVTLLGGRNFTATPELWEGLIQLVLIRKNGDNPAFRGIYCSVEIEPIMDHNEDDYESIEPFIPQAH